MRLPTLIAPALAAGLALAAPAGAHDPAPAAAGAVAQLQPHDPANCFCRAKGRMFAIGESACLATGDGPRLAECGMVLNNTSWRFTARPCPES